MSANGLQAYFINNEYNRRYMTGFTGSSGYVLITLDRAVLLTDFRYMTQAPKQAKAYEVIEHGAQVMETVQTLLKQMNISQLAFEKDHVTYGEYQSFTSAISDIEWIPTTSLIEQIRLIKDEREIQWMQEAARIADQAFEYILTRLRPGITEQEIALELEMFMRKHGATSSSFDTIVASGERSALPHGVASERVLQPNEFVKLDFGAYYKGYCSDITRTVLLGKPEQRHREIYEIVRQAQEACLNGLKPGMTGKEGDALARNVIEQNGYGQYFGHSTGHGLGLEIHEAPRLSKNADMRLETGMVFTVEPGIYLPGFGGVRIEDDVILMEDGVKLLTRASKDFITID